MKTLLEIVNLSSSFLQQKGIQHPRRQAEELIADALGMKRLQLYLEFDRPLTDSELEICRKRLGRRAKGEPNPYIHGEVEFYNCHFKLNNHVLIPRQETEILVDKIAKQLAPLDLKGKILWDVCCGSGCIGIALKKKFPDLHVELSDISEEALGIAQENARFNEVNVDLHDGDFLTPFHARKTDFFVCNPPYISEEEFVHLDTEVKNYEPKSALVSGPTGLEFYARLAKELKGVLNPKAKGWFEIGTGQGKAVESLFSQAGWENFRVEKDWAGHDRFFFLEIE